MSDTAAVLEASAEFTAGRPDRVGNAIAGNKSVPWGYWKKENGAIVTGQFTPNEYIHNLKQGWTPYENGPRFLMTETDRRQGFRAFLDAGGAKEFPLRQILEAGWHRKPPVVNGKPVEFPQLRRDAEGRVLVPNAEGVDEPLIEPTCPVCRKIYLSIHDLQRHESVAHKDTSTQNQLARLMTDATAGQMAPTNAAMVEALKTLATVVQGISDQQTEMQARQQQAEERFLAVIERLGTPAAATRMDEMRGAMLRTVREKK